MTDKNKFTPMTVQLYELETEMRVSWIDAEFIGVDKLFPCWVTAKIMLTKFVQKIGDWAISSVPGDPSNIVVGLEFPNVRNVLTGELVPMVETFPPEDRPQVIHICHRVMGDYVSDLNPHRMHKVTQERFERIKMEIRSRQSYIESLGGRPVKAELAFRLGLWGWEG